ncbi:MAG TPA: TonB-dependent receptor [Chitinophagales bacterium]|nr:TonB-dependent receptor [Chitinophagales bacterium]
MLIMLAWSTRGQEAYIFGTVKDSKTLEVLVGVNVIADENHGTLTDAEGKYRLKLHPGSYKITYSFISYETVKKNVDLKDGAFREINIALEPRSEQLEIVVVTASQYEKNIAQETVSMDVLSEELIENTNSRDLGEALLKTPGVQVQDAQISIRGGSSYSYGVGSRTSVLVDGQSYLSADLNDAKLKFVPLEDAEQVEVIKGASSVVYGSSALNGVVNVRTGWPKTGEKVTEVNTYFGAYGRLPREETRWTGNVRGFSGLFFNHRQRVKNVQLLCGGNIDFISSYLENADEFRVRGNVKTRYNLPHNPRINFGLNANIMKEVSERFFVSADLDSFIYQFGQGSLDKYIQTAVNPHVTYIDSSGNRLVFNIQYFNVFRKGDPKHDTIANYADSTGSTIDSVVIDYGTPNAVSNSFSLDPQYQKNWNERFVLTAGTPFNVGFSKSNLYSGKRVNFSGAGYAQLEFNFENFSVVGGMRYEFSSVDSVFETSIPVFRFGANYKAGTSTYLRMSWGQAYRLPSVGERFIAAHTVGIYIIPNPELQVEKGWSTELGVKQLLSVKKWKGYFDFSAYLMKYDEFVEYRFGNYSNYWPGTNRKIFPEWGSMVFGAKPNNVDDARIFGFEASLAGSGRIGAVKINTLIGYTYVYPGNLDDDSTQQNIGAFFKNAFKYFATRLEGEEAVKLLQFRQRHLLRGDIELSWKKFSFGYSLSFISFFERIPPEFVALVTLIEIDNTNHSPPYTLEKYIDEHKNGDVVMDARAGYLLKENVRLGFIVKNLTNLEYALRPGKADAPVSFTAQCVIRF